MKIFGKKVIDMCQNEETHNTIQQMILELMSQEFEENLPLENLLKKVGFCNEFAFKFSQHILSHCLDMSWWEWIEHFIGTALDGAVTRGIEWNQDGSNTPVETQYSAKKGRQ